MSGQAVWYIGAAGQQRGPATESQVRQWIASGEVGPDAYVYGPGLTQWTPIRQVPAFQDAFHAAAPPPTPPPATTAADDIDYELHGAEMQFVEVTLDPGEAVVSEAGALMYMEDGIQMETVFGDGSSKSSGFMGKLFQAGKRLLTGESLFMTVFSNAAQVRRKVAFAAPYPGKIVPVDLRQVGGVLICQKDAFLCAARGVSVGVEFHKKIGAGLFGGEGFLLQRLEGQGLAFVHAGGTILQRDLQAGETLRIDTGCIVAFVPTVNYDIRFVGGIKSALFGGEGLFFATLTGPGRVWLQSLPFSRLADRIYSAMPKGGGQSVGEGSILGGLGQLVMGDE